MLIKRSDDFVQAFKNYKPTYYFLYNLILRLFREYFQNKVLLTKTAIVSQYKI